MARPKKPAPAASTIIAHETDGYPSSWEVNGKLYYSLWEAEEALVNPPVEPVAADVVEDAQTFFVRCLISNIGTLRGKLFKGDVGEVDAWELDVLGDRVEIVDASA